MRKIILTVAIVALLSLPAVAKKGEYRDRHNNLVGTSERHGDRTEYRDRHNNLTGTSQRRGSSTEYRDRNNNYIGEERFED